MYYLGQKYSSYNKLIYLFLLLFAYTFVFGTRYGVGIDHITYLKNYENWDFMRDVNWLRYEPGFVLFTNICYDLSLSTALYFSIISFFMIGSLLFHYRKDRFIVPYIALVFMISCTGITGCTNGIRQFMAISVLLLIFPFLCERRILPYIGGVLVATMFHKTAIILIPIYALTYIKDSVVRNRSFIIACCISMIAFVFIRLILGNTLLFFIDDALAIFEDNTYDNYLETDYVNLRTSIGVFRLIKLCFGMWVASLLSQMSFFFKDKIKYFDKIALFWLVGTILYCLFEGSLVMQRMILYLTIFEIYLYACLIYYLLNTRKYLVAVVLLIMSVNFVSTISNGENNSARYVSIFQTSEHVQKEKELYMK